MDYSRISAKVAIVIDSGGPPSEIQSASPYYMGYTIRGCLAAPRMPASNRRRVSPAITIASEVVLGLPQGRQDHETTGNVGKIAGGQVVNAVPDYCKVEGEMRSMEFEKVDSLVSRSQAHVDEVRQRHPDARIEAEFAMKHPGYKLEDDDSGGRPHLRCPERPWNDPEPASRRWRD